MASNPSARPTHHTTAVIGLLHERVRVNLAAWSSRTRGLRFARYVWFRGVGTGLEAFHLKPRARMPVHAQRRTRFT